MKMAKLELGGEECAPRVASRYAGYKTISKPNEFGVKSLVVNLSQYRLR